MSQPPDAIILAGGLGTRLQSALPDLPKALAPVLGRPFLLHLLDLLARLGVRRVTLALGYRAPQIKEAVAGYDKLEIGAVTEERPLGTGGALRLAVDQARGKTLLALNGDSVAPFDLNSFLAFHEQGGFDVSLIGVRMEDASRFGLLALGDGGRILAFQEKRLGSSGVINAGIYLIERRVLEALPAGRALSFERDVLERLSASGRLGAFVASGPFIDIGTPQSYAQADAFFAAL